MSSNDYYADDIATEFKRKGRETKRMSSVRRRSDRKRKSSAPVEEGDSTTWVEEDNASGSEENTPNSSSQNTMVASEHETQVEEKPARWNLRKRQKRFPGMLKFDQEVEDEDFSQFIQQSTMPRAGSYGDLPPRYNLRNRSKGVEEERLHYPRYNLRPNRGIAAQALPGSLRGLMLTWRPQWLQLARLPTTGQTCMSP